MPELSRFLGIVIKMYFDDYNPPHFHVEYGDFSAEVLIDSCKIKKGSLPSNVSVLVEKWHKLHKTELETAWEKAKQNQMPNKINPL